MNDTKQLSIRKVARKNLFALTEWTQNTPRLTVTPHHKHDVSYKFAK